MASEKMSLAMGILACNVFGYSKLSYLNRVLRIPDVVRRELDAVVRGYVLPAPTVKWNFLSHLKGFVH